MKIAPGSILRRLSAEAASQLAGQKRAKASGPGTQNILDGSVALTVAELRRGDAVVIATLERRRRGGAGTSVTAIAVIAGVEPLLKRSAEAQREALGSWDLSLDPEGRWRYAMKRSAAISTTLDFGGRRCHAAAQGSGGIRGVITDTSGAVVAGATVELAGPADLRQAGPVRSAGPLSVRWRPRTPSTGFRSRCRASTATRRR